MASHQPLGTEETAMPPPRSLPGFAAFLRPRAQLHAVDDHAFKHEPSRAELYPPRSFTSVFHRESDSHANHQPYSHQFGLTSLRPPVVAPAPLPYETTDYSLHATFKPRKLDEHDSPSTSARRANGSPRFASAASSSSSSSFSTTSPSSTLFTNHHLQHQRQSVRTSRYLREVDRRTILQRIQNGEKQADLAKEYQVSRAAISNLKQRRRLKEKQHGATRPQSRGHAGDDNDDDQMDDEKAALDASRDPRRPRRRRSSSDGSSSPPSETPEPDDAAIHAVASLHLSRHVASPPTASQAVASSWIQSMGYAERPPVQPTLVHGGSIALLLTQLQRLEPSGSFRSKAERLARLLLEEALGRLPTRPVQASARAINDDAGVAFARPVCAIAVNDGRGSQLLLDEFRVIEPQFGVGAIQTHPPREVSSSIARASLVHSPDELTDSSVLLLDLACSETGDEICAAMETLQTNGVDPRNVVVVTVVGYATGFARVQIAFPSLRGVLTTMVLRSSTSPGGRSDVSDAPDLVQLLQTRLNAPA